LAILETKDLTCKFGGLVAVSSVNYKLEKDDLAALIGPNGAGKSTFLKMIAGMWYPTSGQILFEGQDITRMPAQDRVKLGIAKSFQICKVFQRMTVLENICLSLRAKHSPLRFYLSAWNDPTSVESAKKILERIDLLDEKDALAGSLPHGSRKCLEVGMSLATEPKLLLLDEPTSGSTAAEMDRMGDLIKEVSKSMPIIVVEHKMDFIMNLVRRISVLHEGRLIADGPTEEIKNSSLVKEVYLGGA
jgi:ABC-type branched-subunit amino acid transport system ATPase component